MRHIYSFLAVIILIATSVKAQKDISHTIVYQSYRQGVEQQDTTYTIVKQYNNKIAINDGPTDVANTIPGLAQAIVYIDYDSMQGFSQLQYNNNEHYYTKFSLSNKNISFTKGESEKVLGYNCTKYHTSINSNSIDIWITTDLGFNATAMAQFGTLQGVMVKYVRNGSSVMELKSIDRNNKPTSIIPASLGIEKTSRELDNIRRNKMIITTKVFDNDRIHWGADTKWTTDMPFDTVVHFAGGTLILKQINIDKLPQHYQIFAELHTYSEGDAYDRTGSIFVIPTEREVSFYDALTKGISVVPGFKSQTGEEYRGMTIDSNYLPIIELMRFFTPFGVRHFNDRVQIDGLEWEQEAYYKQEITDLASTLSGDVLIGAFIGNYDGGGHKVSLDIKAYPGDYEWNTDEEKYSSWVLPIFNTCNVMEMAGQNYPRFFDTDSLTVSLVVPEGVENLRLRYISTGHGGWGGGDEFNPKENQIIIDGEKVFTHTPWRSDCATFREFNPVSGNFWNGVSSSDLSRSGWCPGTATQPVYFDLPFLAPGVHTITVVIPQGKEEGGNFSAWSVSGALIGTKRKESEKF